MLSIYDEQKDLLERVEDVILKKRRCTERLLDFAENVKGDVKSNEKAIQNGARNYSGTIDNIGKGVDEFILRY
jgi:5-methyltetrahydrofolate--homocysteine methyltransferase